MSQTTPAKVSLDLALLRALAYGGKRSVEIQLLLDGESGRDADWQKLALTLTGLSVPRETARATFEAVRRHLEGMRNLLGRPVKVKTAIVDLLETQEASSGSGEGQPDFTYDELVQMAFHDQLTGLNNYRNFMRRFPRELKRAERYHHLVSLMMIDIDRFKDFNDRFGHEAGNAALVHVAGILRAGLRETDLLARYGGEEFAVLLPETARHEAAAIAESLRQSMQHAPVELPEEGPQTLTISLGVATFPRDARDGKAIVAAADEALYASKEAGRNRVTAYRPASCVTLRYAPRPGESVSRASVAGDFNAWNADADPMQREADGRFAATCHLAPGRYVYKFVLDGERYLPDPEAKEFVHDSYGGKNSVLVVP